MDNAIIQPHLVLQATQAQLRQARSAEADAMDSIEQTKAATQQLLANLAAGANGATQGFDLGALPTLGLSDFHLLPGHTAFTVFWSRLPGPINSIKTFDIIAGYSDQPPPPVLIFHNAQARLAFQAHPEGLAPCVLAIASRQVWEVNPGNARRNRGPDGQPLVRHSRPSTFPSTFQSHEHWRTTLGELAIRSGYRNSPLTNTVEKNAMHALGQMVVQCLTLPPQQRWIGNLVIKVWCWFRGSFLLCREDGLRTLELATKAVLAHVTPKNRDSATIIGTRFYIRHLVTCIMCQHLAFSTNLRPPAISTSFLNEPAIMALCRALHDQQVPGKPGCWMEADPAELQRIRTLAVQPVPGGPPNMNFFRFDPWQVNVALLDQLQVPHPFGGVGAAGPPPVVGPPAQDNDDDDDA